MVQPETSILFRFHISKEFYSPSLHYSGPFPLKPPLYEYKSAPKKVFQVASTKYARAGTRILNKNKNDTKIRNEKAAISVSYSHLLNIISSYFPTPIVSFRSFSRRFPSLESSKFDFVRTPTRKSPFSQKAVIVGFGGW